MKIDKNTKDFLIESFYKASEQIGNEEFHYIREKINEKINLTSNSGTSWVRDLSYCFQVLYKYLNLHFNNKKLLSNKTINYIASALFYFINPYDIIPDYTPGIGYLDDLIIYKTCIRSLSKKDIKAIMNYEKQEINIK